MSETLHEVHCALVDKVNNSKTELEHRTSEIYLNGWRDGVRSTGRRVDLIAQDIRHINNGIDRPMCCGVFLDWKPIGV